MGSIVPYWLGYEPQISYLRPVKGRYLRHKGKFAVQGSLLREPGEKSTTPPP